MNDRHAALLYGLVDEYIEHARPMGSAHLARTLGMALRPSTIRLILQDLEAAGYVYQPHTSAGRIPTDQGYRHYVDTQPEQTVTHHSDQQVRKVYGALRQRGQSPARLASKILSQLTHTLAMTGVSTEGNVHEAGLGALVDETAAEGVEMIREASGVLDAIDEHLDDLAEVTDGQVTVYIGRENPFFPTRHTSMIVRSIRVGDDHIVLALLGPKRMPYNRNVALLTMVSSLFEEEVL